MKPRKLLIALPIVAALFVIATGSLTAQSGEPDPLLHLCQDHASLERQIAAYIEAEHDLTAIVDALEDKPSDIWLEYRFEREGAPEITVFVDTDTTVERDDGFIEEQRIEIWAFSTVPADKQTDVIRRKILEINNTWMDENWNPGGIYIDGDGDVAFQSNLNIPGPGFPIHAEMVYDQVVRMSYVVRDYHKLLMVAFGD